MSENEKGFALVTGASAGIGAVYADRLARRGFDLILVARRQDRLSSLADRIVADTGRKVEVVAADLSNGSDLKRVEDILRNDGRISLLVNNAGLAAIGPLLHTNVDQMSELLKLNVDALTRLTYAVAPRFVEQGSGTIVNIASAVAIGPETLNGVYGASKAFVLALSQSLKHELADKGVRIQVVLPGATATDIWANAGLPVENLPKEIVMSSEAMVDAALAGLDQGEFATAPALAELADWDNFENERKKLAQKLSRSEPARRYVQ
ncbi:SDR family NAD(P)-dependent oxidoreductase [Paraburkholderia caribensis]|uniref:SDR family NAD(P)-dependent oxidoreductase n=1 Tax=Paraburkholderia caribensis TaxID=75105 RepID=UPI001CAB0EF4|nr:SDR family oxidoreductase [Paraburkholderia caribensis]CAG9249517.1 Short-chain dehydrogenases of various substrate specificities [Paraburkholderia caribensis]